jgi:hypothetical protein
MKTAVKLVLLMFILFLSTPTIVSMIEKNCDTSVFFSMTEEELVHKEIKEVKADLRLPHFELVLASSSAAAIIISKNKLKHDNVTSSIFSPPPNV